MSVPSTLLGEFDPPPADARNWYNPIKAARRRFHGWAMARLPITDTLTLAQNNIYILPSRAGLMLGVTLLVLLVASINYQLNLGYLLTFLLAGSAVIGMHVSHSTLRALQLSVSAPPPQHMGTGASFDVVLTNRRHSTRYGIGLAVLNQAMLGHWAWTDVPAQGMCSVRIAFQPRRRGRHRLPALNAETRYPLGTFRVWSVWRPAAQMLIYPEIESSPPPLPFGGSHRAGAAASNRQSNDEFDGVRAYQRGDPFKRVVWKKAAKTGELVSRDATPLQREELWLDFHATGLIGTEERLARLCAWVLRAQTQGLDYGLRLPGQRIAPACGPMHQQRCLEALALF